MTKNKKESSQLEGWEVKDRNYYLTGNKSPLTYTIPSRHSERVPILWFDEEKQNVKEQSNKVKNIKKNLS